MAATERRIPEKLSFKISWAERLFLKRLRLGWKQPRMAGKLKVQRSKLQRFEYGDYPDTPHHGRVVVKGGGCTVSEREYCILARRRAHWTQSRLAREIGVTRQWVVMMERGEKRLSRMTGKMEPVSCKKLIRYWKATLARPAIF